MPSARLPLVSPVNENLDPIESTVFADEIWDGFLNEAGSLVRRPGVKDFCTLPVSTKVDGLYFWEEVGVLVAVSNGNVYTIDEDGNYTLIGNGMNFGSKVSFAAYNTSGDQRLAMCNGGSIWILKGGSLNKITDVDAPTSATNVIHFDGYLISNNLDDGTFRYSEVLNVESWSALDFGSAESKPDPIVAVRSIGGYIYLIGSRTTEVYYNDESTPFVRNRSLELPGGTLAPDSVVQVRQSLIYLDDRKRVVIHTGGDARVVSGAISQDLLELTESEEVSGASLTVSGKIFYVLRSKSETFVYDIDNGIWYRWGKWNSLTREYDNYYPAIIDFSRKWGRSFIASGSSDGKVLEVSRTTYQDEGEAIRTSVRSGYIDHGTALTKTCKTLAFRVKRGTASVGETEVLVDLRARNELGGWDLWKSFEIGEVGDTDFYVWFMGLGIYRARQWEVSCASNTPFIMSGVTEEFDLGAT
jgi:hypothetical protein